MPELNKKAKIIFSNLAKQKQSISFAESCTGGGLAESFSRVPGVSEVFFGSITSYANDIKQNILQVDAKILESEGAVSESVALLMAENCAKLFSSDWAMSTTGIAGPSGGSIEKPVGTVWIGIFGPNIHVAKKYVFENVDRLTHRKLTIDACYDLFAQSVE